MTVTNYTEETYYLDYNEVNFKKHVHSAIKDSQSDKEKLKAWYLYVRDNWSYSPYTIYLRKEKYKASVICNTTACHCIDKSILFSAGLRLMGIPSRIHLAKVKNHIAAERMIEKIGTDELAPHGFVGVYFNDKWTKASPIFDSGLCDYLNVDVLEYDGTKDSIFQEFDKKGSQFMEYLKDYGEYADLPFDFIMDIMATEYPKFAGQALESGKDVVIF